MPPASRALRRTVIAAAAAAILASAAWLAFAPRAVEVETGTVLRGPLAVTVADEGRTRVRDRHVVAAPVAGQLRRVEMEAGDPVSAGAIITEISAPEAPLRDARARAEAGARVDAAEDDVARQLAELERASSAEDLARADLERAKALHAGGVLPKSALDAAESAWLTSRAATRSASFGTRVARHELEVARLVAERASALPRPTDVVAVTSPVDGRILRVLRESAGPVAAGDPIVEVGDPAALEVVVDLVTSDAVNVREGAPARLAAWGRPNELPARVRRIEPSAHAKVSALGIEEQRVDVVLDIAGEEASADSASLGDGFGLEARIVTWESDDTLQAPAGALFRRGEGWAAFVVRGGRARLVGLQPGHWAEVAVEIASGLAPGDVVVVHPPESLRDGSRVVVTPRSP